MDYLRGHRLHEAIVERCDPDFAKDIFHFSLQLGYFSTYKTELFESKQHVVLVFASSLASNAVPCAIVSSQILAKELKTY